jgi:alkylation response protein AidB-like acyl-CoA dehydrogenase
MYSLSLLSEQIEIRDTVRDFVAREIKPAATHPDRLQRMRPPFPADLLVRTESLGLRTLMIPEMLGGAGADTLTACIVIEELAAGDVDVAMALAHTIAAAGFVFGGAHDAPGDALQQFMADESMHLAYAGARARGPGWRYHRARETEPPSTAMQRGESSVLNGDAGFVVNAPIAKRIVIEIGTGAGARLAVVPRDAPGLYVREARDDSDTSVRWFHGAGGYVTFSDCGADVKRFAPDVRERDRYFRRLKVLEAAANVGVGRAAFEAAVDYAKLRVQGARPIIQHQAIGTKLADIAIGLDAARNMIWKAAFSLDHPAAVAERSIEPLPFAAAARAFTAEVVCGATEKSAECFGAMGVMRDMPLQKYVHDAVIFLNSGTSVAVNKFEVAEAVAGFDPSR